MKKGLIQVYTGDGKGKTTAAVGLCARAIGQGLEVCYISFHKDPDKYGYAEQEILKKLGADVFVFAKEHPFCDKNISFDEIRKKCLDALIFVENIFKENKYDVLILDEVNISVRDGFLKEDEVLDLLLKKPETIEVVLTGRGATEKIISIADLVSEVKEIKHPYKKGIKGRKGIEF